MSNQPKVHSFDEDTAVQLSETVKAKGDDVVYKCNLAGKWHIMGNLHGGYLAAVMLRALSQSLPHPDPSLVNIFYFRRGKEGPAQVIVNKIKSEGNFSYGEARLVQNGQEIARTVASFTNLEENPQRVHYSNGIKSLEIPDIDKCFDDMPHTEGSRFGLFEQLQLLHAPDTRFMVPPNNTAEVRGWLRFREERPLDCLSLALFLDSNNPPGQNLSHSSLSNYPNYRSWYPTVGLTLYFRRKPNPTHTIVKGEWRSKFLVGRTLDVEGEIWDVDGNILAQAHQLSVPITSKL